MRTTDVANWRIVAVRPEETTEAAASAVDRGGRSFDRVEAEVEELGAHMP